MNVIAYTHTHWDREWYQPFQEFRIRLIDTVDMIIEELTSGKLSQFYFDGQTIALEDYLEIFPQKRELIKNLIAEDKLKIGPWYALADEFLVSGESLIRNLLIGINQSKEFGCDQYLGYLPDAFGHIASMPMILNSFGIKNAVLWRGAGNNQSEFIWQSLDNSSVTATYLTEGYFQDFLHGKANIETKTANLKKFLDNISKYSASDTILLPIGADHLAPPSDIDKIVGQISTELNDYEMKSGSIFSYIDYINSKKLDLVTVKDELRDNVRNFILPSCASTRLYLKQKNAISTWKLTKLAEPLQAFLENLSISKTRKYELEYAWKLLLKNHPHDSICGCSKDDVHRQMMSRYEELDNLTDGIINRNLNALSHQVKEGDLVICNLSNYEYNGVVKVKASKKLPKNLSRQFVRTHEEFPNEILFDLHRPPVREDIEKHDEYLIYADKISANSIKVVNMDYKNTEMPDSVEVTDKSISNSKVELKVNYDGTFNIKDLETLTEFKNLQVFEDIADVGDTYNFCPIPNDKPIKAEIIKSKIYEAGELRSVLRLKYLIQLPKRFDNEKNARSEKIIKHSLTVDISLCTNSKRLEFKAHWENKALNHLLKMKFNTGRKIFKTISEDNFGVIERKFNPDYDINSVLPVEKGKEAHYNSTHMQRFVSANGLTVITEGLSEYDVEGKNLNITLLRSVGILSEGAIPTRGTPAGPPILTPEAQCLGKQTARYAICLCDEIIEIFRECDEFMGSTLATQGIGKEETLKSAQFVNFENQNIYIYTTKLPVDEKSGVIIRCLNLSGQKQLSQITLNSKFSQITETNSLEECISKPISIADVIEFKPNELKTFLVE